LRIKKSGSKKKRKGEKKINYISTTIFQTTFIMEIVDYTSLYNQSMVWIILALVSSPVFTENVVYRVDPLGNIIQFFLLLVHITLYSCFILEMGDGSKLFYSLLRCMH
jgi:hypothetical protein